MVIHHEVKLDEAQLHLLLIAFGMYVVWRLYEAIRK